MDVSLVVRLELVVGRISSKESVARQRHVITEKVEDGLVLYWQVGWMGVAGCLSTTWPPISKRSGKRRSEKR